MQPYKRIIRPEHLYNTNITIGHAFLNRKDYCNETRQLIHAFHIIQDDFRKLMDYVELHNDNNTTFSHRIYELLLRTCTEFENNCKGVLLDNNYSMSGGNLKIFDYFKINKASKLNEYTVKIKNWFPEPLEIKPFQEWNSDEYSSLFWYKAYNNVKHNRSDNFQEANLKNLTYALAGLFVILISQFDKNIFNQFQEWSMSLSADDGYQSSQNSIFSFKYPNWTDSDLVEHVSASLLENENIEYSIFNFNI